MKMLIQRKMYIAHYVIFGITNRPTERTILNIVHKFKETGLVKLSSESVAAVRKSLYGNPKTSTRHRSQELNLSRTTLRQILTKDLIMHAYKIQLTQELRPSDHLKRRTFANWISKQAQLDKDFSQKIIFKDEAHLYLSGCVNKQNCGILVGENPRDNIEKPMHPERVTAWCGFWAGGIIGLFF